MGVGHRVAVAVLDEREAGRARDPDRVAGLEPQRLLARGPAGQRVTVAGDDDVSGDPVHRDVHRTRGDHHGSVIGWALPRPSASNGETSMDTDTAALRERRLELVRST